jgi:hypothetical protein
MLPAIFGAPASFNAWVPLSTDGGALTSGPGDTIMGQFVWCDPYQGTVANTRTQPYQIQAFLPTEYGSWNKIYVAPSPSNAAISNRYLRQGYQCVPIVRGDFWARFASGAVTGQTVYASLVDGSPISGYAANAEATRWTVITNCGANGLAVISTWSTFT